MSAFYARQARSGAGVGDLLAVGRRGSRGGWKQLADENARLRRQLAHALGAARRSQ